MVKLTTKYGARYASSELSLGHMKRIHHKDVKYKL